MRKIKFRGKTVDTKELIYGDLIQTEKDFKNVVEILDWSKVGCKPEKSLVVNPDTVGQFTGLTDKNGVEIYEGDIVIYDGKNSLCSFIKGSFVFGNEFDLAYGYEVKVIGNIHENPELL